MSTPKLTKENAQKIASNLDALASLFQEQHKILGVPPKVANEFAYRCDLLSDHVEKRAGLQRKATVDPKSNTTETKLLPESFDPAEIGEEETKPPLRNADEPYMDAFRQEEFDQLRHVQQKGEFSNAKAAAALVVKMAKLLQAKNVPLPVVGG